MQVIDDSISVIKTDVRIAMIWQQWNLPLFLNSHRMQIKIKTNSSSPGVEYQIHWLHSIAASMGFSFAYPSQITRKVEYENKKKKTFLIETNCL